MSMPWYGELPARWEAHKVSELFAERREKVSDTDYAPLSVSKGGIVPQIATVAKSNAGDNRKLVRRGDFAINSRSDRRGSSGISQYNGSVSLINIVLTPRSETNGKYWHYLLKSHNFIEEYYRNGRGIVADLWTTRLSEMKTVYLPLPPRNEQDQIVRYLDWKVSQINKLINAKRKQIGLLGEQKRAVINYAVTKGLNPDAPMQESGEKWIGAMPKGWVVKQISKIATVIRGASPRPAGDPKYFNGTHTPWITVGELTKDENMHLTSTETFLTAAGVKNSRYIENGTLLLTNSGATLGVPKISSISGCINDGSVALLNPIMSKEFLYYILKTRTEDLRRQVSGYGQPNVNTIIVKGITVPVPSLCEQQAIVAHLDEQCGRIDKLIGKLNEEITLFAEYRTRLISDVVTGKIDMRGVAVPEYDIVDEIADNGTVEDEGANEMEEE